MVIVLVGNTHSGKSGVADTIIKASNGHFSKATVYTTKPGLDGYVCVSEEQYREYGKQNDVFYETTDSEHNKFFTLTTEMCSGRDLIYCIDEPDAIEYVDDLHLPYCVVFVNSSMAAILMRSADDRDNTRLTKMRLEKVATRMKQFDKSAKYTLYINTSLPDSESGIKHASAELVELIDDWLKERGLSDNFMTPLCVTYGQDWCHSDSTVFAL